MLLWTHDGIKAGIKKVAGQFIRYALLVPFFSLIVTLASARSPHHVCLLNGKELLSCDWLMSYIGVNKRLKILPGKSGHVLAVERK